MEQPKKEFGFLWKNVGEHFLCLLHGLYVKVQFSYFFPLFEMSKFYPSVSLILTLNLALFKKFDIKEKLCQTLMILTGCLNKMKIRDRPTCRFGRTVRRQFGNQGWVGSIFSYPVRVSGLYFWPGSVRVNKIFSLGLFGSKNLPKIILFY